MFDELSKIRCPLDMIAYGLQSISCLNNCSKDPCLIINHSPLFVQHGSPHMVVSLTYRTVIGGLSKVYRFHLVIFFKWLLSAFSTGFAILIDNRQLANQFDTCKESTAACEGGSLLLNKDSVTADRKGVVCSQQAAVTPTTAVPVGLTQTQWCHVFSHNLCLRYCCRTRRHHFLQNGTSCS